MKSVKRSKSNVSDKNRKRIRAGSETQTNHVNQDTRDESMKEEDVIPLINTKTAEILAFGSGDVGQLGLGEDVIEKLRPALLPDLSDIVQVYAGGMHNICLRQNGEVLTWGCNDEGALGRTGSESVPIKVDLPAPAVEVSAGDSHSAALLRDGRLFVWGSFRDASGTMGLINLDIVERQPVQVLVDQFITKMDSGADHLVVLNKSGNVFTFGCGQQGQLGRLSSRTTDRDNRHGIAASLTPSIVLQSNRVTKNVNVWAGNYCTFVLNEDGDVYVFGLNNYYQIGLSKTEPYFRPTKCSTFKGKKWKKIACGMHHTIALDLDGKVYALGRKEYGRLGLGENCEDAKQLMLIKKLENKKCVDVACGSSTSFAVTHNGELYSWGMGTGGALGNGEEDDIYEPTLVKGKQLADRAVLQVSSGGQHTIILANLSENNNIKNV